VSSFCLDRQINPTQKKKYDIQDAYGKQAAFLDGDGQMGTRRAVAMGPRTTKRTKPKRNERRKKNKQNKKVKSTAVEEKGKKKR
jgi:hypothetical protein